MQYLPARKHSVILAILKPIGPEKHKTLLKEKCKQGDILLAADHIDTYDLKIH